ncbi:MAG: C10 family peptidase, partial [Prevotella sp.]|nr:C10 family peptidase [Prevotella sp.]
MRRLFFILASIMLTMAVMAEGIDRNAALLKAQKFMPGKDFTMGKAPAKARAKAPQKNDAYYVFNAKDNGGFVIVSGDDRTEEILCYSEHGNLDVDKTPDNMKWWLDELARQIESLGMYLKAAPHRAPSAAIAPLIKSKWSQHAPYNYMCPDGNHVDYDESGYNTENRCVTGCVATAMAQIMYYWKWPKTCPSLDAYEVSTGKTLKGLPATTFKWDKMKDSYGWEETGASANAVAELLRYCGQAVHMGYSPSGSGAAVSANVMASIFQYSPNSHDLFRDNYSVSRWESIIYEELANRRPVLYDGGSNSGAHQFIVDGYDGAGLFHFNWGWGGGLDCYGVLSLADPYGDGNGFHYGQGAIIGVKPAENGEVMMPFMYSWINNNVPAATYSRSASADNFTSVSLNGQVFTRYTLEPTSSIDVEMGWGLFQDDRMLQLLDSKTMTFEASSRWGNYYEYNATASFGAGLADGLYELSHVYRFSNDTEWEPCHLDGNKFWAEIKGNTLKVFVPNPDNMSFTVNSLTTSDEPIATETVSVNVNITNTGESKEEIVSLWIQKPGDEQWTNISKTSYYVDPNKRADVTTSFVPDIAGVYQLKITMGSSEEALATATVKVATFEQIVIDGITYRCIPDYRKAAVINDGKNNHDISGDVTILQKVTASGVDCQVTSIGYRAFEDWYQIISVTIPEGVTSIENNAFAYCSNLNKVVLPSTVTRFGESVFWDCSHLSAVCSYIQNPPAVSDNAFTTRKWNGQTQQYDPTPCPAILYVPVGTKAQYEAQSGWKWFAGIEEGELLEATVGGLRYYYSTGNGKATVIQDDSYQELTEVSIPATVSIDGKSYRVIAIGSSAFDNCWQLQSLTLSEGLESIGDRALSSLNITELILPSTLKAIGEQAFSYSSSIKTLTIPEGVTTIGNYAFAYMYGLTKLELPNSLKEIGDRVIQGCSRLEAVVSHITNPYAVSDYTFTTSRWNEQAQQYDLTPSPATLYVPVGTKAQYEALAGWKWFAGIEVGELLETTVGGLRYSYCTGNGKATVIQDDSYQEFTEVSIPATVSIDGKDYRVNSIGSSAFY